MKTISLMRLVKHDLDFIPSKRLFAGRKAVSMIAFRIGSDTLETHICNN